MYSIPTMKKYFLSASHIYKYGDIPSDTFTVYKTMKQDKIHIKHCQKEKEKKRKEARVPQQCDSLNMQQRSEVLYSVHCRAFWDICS